MKITLQDKNSYSRVAFEGEVWAVKSEMREVYGDQGAEIIFERLGIFQSAQPQRREMTGRGGGPLTLPPVHQMEVSQ